MKKTQINMNVSTLARKAKKLFPKSKSVRRQWVEKTLWLYHNDKHVLYKDGEPFQKQRSVLDF